MVAGAVSFVSGLSPPFPPLLAVLESPASSQPRGNARGPELRFIGMKRLYRVLELGEGGRHDGGEAGTVKGHPTLGHAISGEKLKLGQECWTPESKGAKMTQGDGKGAEEEEQGDKSAESPA